MKLRIITLAIAMCLLGACTGYTPQRYDPALYPRSYRFYDLALFWRIDRDATRITIPGFVRNTRYAYIKDLELSATLLDEKGKAIGEATMFFFPRLLAMDELAPFTLNIPLKSGAQPAKLKFFYRYRLAERGYGGSPYFYSFETEI